MLRKGLMLLSLVLLLPSCSKDIPVLVSKEELKQSWPLTCVHKSDKLTEKTAESILKSNINREEWVGKEECPKQPPASSKGTSAVSKAK
jgi:hypothetical protein